jgi:hypothetical protein
VRSAPRSPAATSTPAGDGLARCLAALAKHPDALVATWARALGKSEERAGSPDNKTERDSGERR